MENLIVRKSQEDRKKERSPHPLWLILKFSAAGVIERPNAWWSTRCTPATTGLEVQTFVSLFMQDGQMIRADSEVIDA